jgi:formate-dependent nitrite reductase membrane component NrfD
MTEHFVRAPEWTWYILFYFFLGGLSGGSYTIATLLRRRNLRDEPAARIGYYVAFAALVPCPVLLTLDLGQPLRFWHMLVDTTPGQLGPVFKYWSPMSVGAWALVIYGFFATVAFLEALGWLRLGGFGRFLSVLGAIAGLFIAGYTGVLLSVSNQPVWSDTWALGGLFLVSGLSASAALVGWLVHRRRDAADSAVGLARSERFFQVLEVVLIVIFAVTLIPAGTLGRAFGLPWLALWIVALLGILSGLSGPLGGRRKVAADGPADADGTATVSRAGVSPIVVMLVLLGVLALRAAVIFSAQ